MNLFKKFIIFKLIYMLALYPCALGDQITPIEKDQKAPYSGILMDQEKANKVKIGLEERNLFEEITKSQARSIDLLKQVNVHTEEKVNILLEQNDKLAERLHSAQGLNNWERIGLVVLGVAMTVGAGYAISKVK